MPTLTATNVTFRTLGVPKAADSVIEVVVTDTTGTIVAQEENSYGAFAPHSSSGPLPVTVLNQVEKADLHPGGSLTLNWQPVTPPATAVNWAFDVNADLIFSDGSKLVVDQNKIDFNAGSDQVVYGL